MPNLEVGQYISDGEKDLLVSSLKKIDNKLYVYLMDEKNDEVFFCELLREKELWKFTRINSPARIQQLIIQFSKDADVLEVK